MWTTTLLFAQKIVEWNPSKTIQVNGQNLGPGHTLGINSTQIQFTAAIPLFTTFIKKTPTVGLTRISNIPCGSVPSECFAIRLNADENDVHLEIYFS
ncbi:MAG: hypothetical protein O2829_03685 [Bacteroidetes bacterium]|nr:hypothetical protein [Bacteroidota bacterium]